ncbi:Outer membrane porin, OmpC family [Paraburkholderia piptadeniae]|uniref:Outer membrane porin, OmpC family n=1 Tax=Paraburkholderia piptadeniae TaxID=1701573 RepID=A0A1N7SQ08_9BURK|nr:porin [Paraburkholderia piptadeniae]SIT49416.1 Outer membrane porin, OmpC family [Paraburkholderia piptadeniae]
MKRTVFSLAIAVLLASETAYAESNVTLYGLIDEGIRFTSNQPSSNGPANRLYMSDGAVTGNRWGIKGTEDLGGGTSAVFVLESGFNPANGVSGQQGQLFGRQAYVGLSNSTYGTLKLGRQYGTAFNYLVVFDSIAVGNQNPNEWEIFLTGVRYDNTVQYTNTWGPVALELERSVGGQAGSLAKGSTTAFDLIFTNQALKIGVYGQQSKDAGNRNMYAASLGGRYEFGAAMLYSYYLYSRRDAGFAPAASNSGGALANTSLTANVTTAAGPQTKARIDNVGQLGVSYAATPFLKLTFAGLYDHVTNAAPGKTGHIASVYGIVDYFLSKRTDVYVEVDHSMLGGASVTDPNSPIGSFAGKNNSTGAMVAMRTRF